MNASLTHCIAYRIWHGSFSQYIRGDIIVGAVVVVAGCFFFVRWIYSKFEPSMPAWLNPYKCKCALFDWCWCCFCFAILSILLSVLFYFIKFHLGTCDSMCEINANEIVTYATWSRNLYRKKRRKQQRVAGVEWLRAYTVS